MRPHGGARLSERVRNLHPSPVRELITAIQQPGMISFAGGLPALDALPRITLGEVPAACLQYGSAEGDPALREAIAQEAQALGLPCTAEQVIVLSGSQQGIDLVAKLFLDPGTLMAVEAPSYVAALQVFQFFGARFTTLDPEREDAGLAGDADQPDGEAWPALAYAIPNFRNPDGACMTEAARARLARACDRFGVVLFEDDPYHDLAYQACSRAPVCARLERASWVYQGSFSKNLAPGLRLGYLVCSPDLQTALGELKQGADLHSSRLSQWLVLQELRDPRRQARLAAVVDSYRRKRDHFADVLTREFHGIAHWQVPAGGLFFWLHLDTLLDTRLLLRVALAHGVAFMPGEPFFAQPPEACGQLRLNFTHASAADVERGLAILAGLVREYRA